MEISSLNKYSRKQKNGKKCLPVFLRIDVENITPQIGAFNQNFSPVKIVLLNIWPLKLTLNSENAHCLTTLSQAFRS